MTRRGGGGVVVGVNSFLIPNNYGEFNDAPHLGERRYSGEILSYRNNNPSERLRRQESDSHFPGLIKEEAGAPHNEIFATFSQIDLIPAIATFTAISRKWERRRRAC